VATSSVIKVSNGKASVIDDCDKDSLVIDLHKTSTVLYSPEFDSYVENIVNGFAIVEECKNRLSEVIDRVPFRIRVTNITVPGYSPTNVPPIGIAIIGFNNYIL
jgi:hypothetical protein